MFFFSRRSDVEAILDPADQSYYEKLGDWFLLHLICKNLNVLLVNDLIRQLHKSEEGSNSNTETLKLRPEMTSQVWAYETIIQFWGQQKKKKKIAKLKKSSKKNLHLFRICLFYFKICLLSMPTYVLYWLSITDQMCWLILYINQLYCNLLFEMNTRYYQKYLVE